MYYKCNLKHPDCKLGRVQAVCRNFRLTEFPLKIFLICSKNAKPIARLCYKISLNSNYSKTKKPQLLGAFSVVPLGLEPRTN
jgi:hypothetical protein